MMMSHALRTTLCALAFATACRAEPGLKTFRDSTGAVEFSLDTKAAPDLTAWAETELAPVVSEWYPKICQLLPSEGYTPPAQVFIVFRGDMNGAPAYARGNRVSCDMEWYRQNLKGEAKGCTVHELVHVVQNYGAAQANAKPNPGWLVEGIADYIRWFLYEPASHGADIPANRIAQVRYDGNYRISANFLNWAFAQPGTSLKEINATARAGKYLDGLWKEQTGKSLEELDAAWKASLKDVPSTVLAETANTLSQEETQAGWKLLFNGHDLNGWSNFKTATIRPGWQVKDGTLACVDPHDAGDLCTADQFAWFELTLEYNISSGGNSGIIFHASDEGEAVWASGPEFQLEDNAKAGDPQRCGWLYALYQPPVDLATNKPLDATKPAGEWNQVRLVVSPEKCEHFINGKKYFEYVLGSEDFKKRVAESKFGSMPLFCKTPKGRIALQGDHGQVAFRNVKVRVLNAK